MGSEAWAGKAKYKTNNKDRKEDDLHTMKHVVYQGEAMSVAHWSVRVEMWNIRSSPAGSIT